MKLLLSPAKSLDIKSEIDCQMATEPIFDDLKDYIVEKLKKLSVKQIESKFKLSKSLAELNYNRYQALDSNENLKAARQAIYTFAGDVYIGFDAYTLPENKFEFAQSTVRILSGLYGILKPFDIIEPHRLEMGSEIAIGRKKNLYEFWSDNVTESLNDEFVQASRDRASHSKVLINLASNEYFHVINRANLSAPILNVDFLENDKGEMKNISFYSKKARGLAARYIVDHEIKKAEDFKQFDSERYAFNSKLSSEWNYVFTRKYAPIGKK